MSDRFADEKTQALQRNGKPLNGHRPTTDLSSTPARPSVGNRKALALFLAGCSSILLLGFIAGVFAYETHEVKGLLPKLASVAKTRNPLMEVAKWQLGPEPAKQLDGQGDADIGLWTRTFDLPGKEAVAGYFKGQGLNVGKITPLHYENTKDAETITYQVYAVVPEPLMRLQKVSWQPADPDLIPFAKVLMLNDGLTPGTMWDTQHPTVAADPGTKLNFSWRVRWDKTDNTVTADRLPYVDAVFTQEQVSRFESAANNTISQLKDQIAQIDRQVQGDVQARLAQVPDNPPKPKLMSSKWGGNGSGEPTRSAERIGGGAAAGAAGGAAFGAAAGDAGTGAGIGAGVGLLGGLIYDGVSKQNDRARYERHVAAVNAERMSDWHAQVKTLDKRRDQVKQAGVTEKQQQEQDLASRISAAKGRLDGTAEPVPDVQQASAPTPQPTSDQPSGPIMQP